MDKRKVIRTGPGKFDWSLGEPEQFRDFFRVDTNFNGTGVEVCFVDPINGNDANAGTTPATAFRTIDQAKGLLGNDESCRHISLSPGVYIADEQFTIMASRPFSMYCPNGKAVIGRWIDEPTFIDQGGGIYLAVVTDLPNTIGYVLDRTKQTESGRFEPYQSANSQTDIDPGEYFVNGNNLYLRTSDGTPPSYLENTLITSQNHVFQPIGNHPIYLENIVVYGQSASGGSGCKAYINRNFLYCKNE